MISNYVNEQHDTWDQFLRELAYAIRTAVNETTGKTHAELFLGRKLIMPFQKLVMVSDGTEFVVGDIERLFEEARRNTKAKHEKLEKYYNIRRRDVQIKVRIYRHRKCDETEIGTGSSDKGSLRDESSGFDRVQRRSNESQDGKKKGSEVKRELEEKGLSFKNDQGPERKIQKGSKHRVPKRALSSNYKTNSNLPKFRKKSRREETVTSTTSGYNLRPRSGKRVESRPTIERKTKQGGPVRSRKGRGRNDSPIEERTRSNNRNARRGGDQQRQDQEGKGACTRKSVSLEVLLTGGAYRILSFRNDHRNPDLYTMLTGGCYIILSLRDDHRNPNLHTKLPGGSYRILSLRNDHRNPNLHTKLTGGAYHILSLRNDHRNPNLHTKLTGGSYRILSLRDDHWNPNLHTKLTGGSYRILSLRNDHRNPNLHTKLTGGAYHILSLRDNHWNPNVHPNFTGGAKQPLSSRGNHRIQISTLSSLAELSNNSRREVIINYLA
ncbi:uncharacterized protein TNCV_3584121 [Trichonephila clavipes]|nr:uncharacterized protein TNCV_3584121 [Trichonephila clavipes]